MYNYVLCLPGLVCQQGRYIISSSNYPERISSFSGTLDDCIDLCVAHTEFTCVATDYYSVSSNHCYLVSYDHISHPERMYDNSGYTYCSMHGKQVNNTYLGHE